MQQGAITLSNEGAIVYCNRHFADLVERPLERLMGVDFRDFVAKLDVHGKVFHSLIPRVQDRFPAAGLELERRAQRQDAGLVHHVFALLVTVNGVRKVRLRLEQSSLERSGPDPVSPTSAIPVITTMRGHGYRLELPAPAPSPAPPLG